MMIGYWAYEKFFMRHLIMSIRMNFSPDVLPYIDVVPFQRQIGEQIWISLPIIFIIFFAIIGLLSVLNNNKNKISSHLQFGAVAVSLAIIVSGLYMLNINEALPGRWIVFMEVMLIFLVVVGLYILVHSKIEKRTLGALFISVMIFSSIMVINGVSSVSTIVPWSHTPRMALSEQERTAAENIYQFSMFEENQENVIFTDSYVIWAYYYDNKSFNAEDAGAIIFREESLDGILLLRDEFKYNLVLIKAPNGNPQEFRMDELQYQSLVETPQYLLIYDSGTVRALKN